MTSTLHIFGDSLMKGTIINDKGRYKATMAARIQDFCKRRPMSIFNHSRFGITVKDGMELLQDEVQNGLSCDYVLIEFGGNDCNFDWQQVTSAPEKDHLPHMPLDKFVSVYKRMVAAVQSIGAKPLLMTLPPINAPRYLDYLLQRGVEREALLKWLGDTEMLYRFHELYSRAVCFVAKETGALLLDIRVAFLNNREYHKLIGLDGLHLSPAGYDYMLHILDEQYERLAMDTQAQDDNVYV